MLPRRPGSRRAVRRCFVVTPVDMFALEATDTKTGVWERGMAVGANPERGGL